MNINLLKKLIQLAGNNPNEHEANSAARRVVTMLYDELMAGKNVTISSFVITKRAAPNPSQPNYQPSQAQQDFYTRTASNSSWSGFNSDQFADWFKKYAGPGFDPFVRTPPPSDEFKREQERKAAEEEAATKERAKQAEKEAKEYFRQERERRQKEQKEFYKDVGAGKFTVCHKCSKDITLYEYFESLNCPHCGARL